MKKWTKMKEMKNSVQFDTNYSNTWKLKWEKSERPQQNPLK